MTEQEIYPVTRQQMDDYRALLDAERNHVVIAHGTILGLRAEVRMLNGVIARRKRGMRRLRAYVDAVKRLHSPNVNPHEHTAVTCIECKEAWPCRTMGALMFAGIDDSDKVINAE